MDFPKVLRRLVDEPDWETADAIAGFPLTPSTVKLIRASLDLVQIRHSVPDKPQLRDPYYNQNAGGITNNRDTTTEGYYWARIYLTEPKGLLDSPSLSDAAWYGTVLINGGSKHAQGAYQDAHGQWGPMLGPFAGLRCVDKDTQHRLESGFFNGYKATWNSPNRNWWEQGHQGFTLRPFLRLIQNLVRYACYMREMRGHGFFQGSSWPELPAPPEEMLGSARRGLEWFIKQKFVPGKSRGLHHPLDTGRWIRQRDSQREWLYLPDANPAHIGSHTTPFMLYYMWPEMAGWVLDLAPGIAPEDFTTINRNWCTWALSIFTRFDTDFGCAKNKRDTFNPVTTGLHGPFKAWSSVYADAWARQNSEPDFHWPLVGAIRYAWGTLGQRLEALRLHHKYHRPMPGALHQRYVYDMAKLLGWRNEA